SFWYLSLSGGLIVLAYGIHRVEPVIILGQLPGTLVYARNLVLIRREKRMY
ncbi:MAG: lipid-A-disaccharide synthase, partial [Betaproteobacteria bacterium HGW-Betaproteobacteria-8]